MTGRCPQRRPRRVTCDLTCDRSLPSAPSPPPEEEEEEGLFGRRRRSTSHAHHLEVMVAADAKMAEYHGDQLQQYILTLMSIVSTDSRSVDTLQSTLQSLHFFIWIFSTWLNHCRIGKGKLHLSRGQNKQTKCKKD